MLYDSSSRIESAYNIGLFLKGDANINAELYIQSLLDKLNGDLGLSLENLRFQQVFTDVEFNKHLPDENEESFINKHFYSKLFDGIKKKKVFDDAKGKDVWILDYKIKFCFTLDKTLAPYVSASGVCYGTMNLGAKPVLYYVWVDVQEVIKAIKPV